MNPESSQSRAAANRANARHSTGPKTLGGKATVARNSIGHGIYALSPVVEGLESVADWEAYHQAMLASLDPQGMLEETLAERIILAAWRLRRTARYETGQIGSEQEAALKQVGQRLGEDLDRKLTTSDVQAVLDQAQSREESLQRVAGLRTASDDSPISEDDADDLLGHVHEHLGQADRFLSYCEQQPAVDTWTSACSANACASSLGCRESPLTSSWATSSSASPRITANPTPW